LSPSIINDYDHSQHRQLSHAPHREIQSKSANADVSRGRERERERERETSKYNGDLIFAHSSFPYFVHPQTSDTRKRFFILEGLKFAYSRERRGVREGAGGGGEEEANENNGKRGEEKTDFQ